MRKPRRKLNPELTGAIYHLYTRTVNREALFGEEEKAMMQRRLWQTAEYCGLEIWTHSEMGNHPHVEICVPRKTPVKDEEILRRYSVLHNPPSLYAQGRLNAMTRIFQETGSLPQIWRERQLAMMGDISPCMQLFKQMYAVWYNRQHHRIGPLWNERFRSEAFFDPGSRQVLATYIDNNSCRAGICQDPKDYPYCGYTEAVAGNFKARAGLMMVMGSNDWEKTHDDYRKLLFERGSIPRPAKAHFSDEAYENVLAAGGKLTEAEVRTCLHLYLTHAEAIGPAEFVQAQIDSYRQQTGRGRRLKPFPLPVGLGLDGLYVMSRPRRREF